MRRVLAGATLILVAATTTACGGGDDKGGDDKKDSANKDDVAAFCEANEKASAAKDLDSLKDAVDDIDKALLSDIPGDAKDGFEILHDAIKKSDSEADFAKMDDDLSKEETDQVNAFGEYNSKTCAEESPSAPPEGSEPETPAPNSKAPESSDAK